MGRKEQGRLTVKVRGQFTFEIDPDLDSETLMRAAVQVFLADPLRYIEFSPNPTSRSRVEQYKALRANGIGAPPKSRANEPLDTHARVSAIQIDFATGRYMMPPGFAQSMAASQSAPPLPPVADEEDAGEGEAAGDAPIKTSGPDDDENDPSAVGGIKLRFSTTASVQAAAADEDARDEEVAAPDADEPRDEEASPQLSTGSVEAPHEAMEYGQDAQRPLESATHHVADDVPPVAGGGAPVEHDEGDRHGRKIRIVEEERPWLPPGLQRPTVLKAPPRD